MFTAVTISFSPEILASSAELSSSDLMVSSSDAAYFDRIAVIPIDVVIPEFYQQVVNVAGMYIFSMPDGTVHKRIYGALNGVYGWYIPVGSENVVPADSKSIDPNDDIALYEAAVEAYEAENSDGQSFSGILPPEHGTYDLTTVLGLSSEDVFKYSMAGAGVLCLIILMGYAVKMAQKKKDRG